MISVDTLNRFAGQWIESMWRTGWQGGLVLLLVLGLCLACRGIGPKAQCWLWRIAYLKLLIGVIWLSPLSLPLLAPAGGESSADFTAVLVPDAPSEVGGEVEEVPAALSGRSWLCLAWLVGVAIVAGRYLRSWRKVRGLVRSASPVDDERVLHRLKELQAGLGLRRSIQVLTHGEIAGPAMVGIWRPSILLPPKLLSQRPSRDLEHVLAHELAHISRCELLWNLLHVAVHTLFFFHPVLWLIRRQWHFSQELACDWEAIRILRADAGDYARTLLALLVRTELSSSPTTFVVGTVNDSLMVKRRLIMLKHLPTANPKRRALLAGVVLLATVGLILPVEVTAGDPSDGSEKKAPPHRKSVDVGGRTDVVDNGNAASAQEKILSINVGDLLFIQMTGDLAKEYARCTRSLKWNESPAGLQISTSATVAQKRDDGRFRIEHSSHIKRDGNLARLVTLTAIVDSTKIASEVTPKNTPVYHSPADHQKGVKPTLTQKDQRTLRLELSELKGVKLRTWALAEEIGD